VYTEKHLDTNLEKPQTNSCLHALISPIVPLESSYSHTAKMAVSSLTFSWCCQLYCVSIENWDTSLDACECKTFLFSRYLTTFGKFQYSASVLSLSLPSITDYTLRLLYCLSILAMRKFREPHLAHGSVLPSSHLCPVPRALFLVCSSAYLSKENSG
jgi:hypothetical protein